MAREKKYKYVPTEKAKKSPTYIIGKEVLAIGGDVTVKKKAPAEPVTINEATAEQYKAYYEACKGKTYLVKKVEA